MTNDENDRGAVLDQVPGRDPYSTYSWEKYAWPSRKNLSSWLADLLERVGLLRRWAANLAILPNPLWLPGLFNVTGFLTALKQVASRTLGLPLDIISLETRVTCMKTTEEVATVGSLSPQGALVHGLFVEGATWKCFDQVKHCCLQLSLKIYRSLVSFDFLNSLRGRLLQHELVEYDRRSTHHSSPLQVTVMFCRDCKVLRSISRVMLA